MLIAQYCNFVPPANEYVRSWIAEERGLASWLIVIQKLSRSCTELKI
ncbi:hypothetical protein CIPAW_02G054400 [Carya illinoinensis]|uniref:Uncharacterized protein n=1 Tax=Carya illinoinensis TaxID=32201 RepID=A0A8T1RB89_CARIL|nr:hypothetical protein CIPAW_02G054400 [Carya illinoinensis]KAG6725909.1 hypothetical protein I3842_02G053900 [Carya illinoinensis]